MDQSAPMSETQLDHSDRYRDVCVVQQQQRTLVRGKRACRKDCCRRASTSPRSRRSIRAAAEPRSPIRRREAAQRTRDLLHFRWRAERAPVYVGETSRLSARAASHLTARWPMRDPWTAYRAFPAAPTHVLRELESDVLGWHFWLTRAAPPCQYRAEHNRPDAG
jgi:hypothetical protein